MPKPMSCFTDRYLVIAKDGIPVNPDRRLVVLDASGNDPAATEALKVYADELHKRGNWKAACDIDGYLTDAKSSPSQHSNVKGQELALFIARITRTDGSGFREHGQEVDSIVTAKILPVATGECQMAEFIRNNLAEKNPDVPLDCIDNTTEVELFIYRLETLFL